jgi:hypothetical protein
MVEDLVKALCYVTGENYENKLSLVDFFLHTYFVVDKDGNFVPGLYNRVFCTDDISEANARAEHIGGKVWGDVKQWGKWMDWGYFRIRAYKKGTIHFEFKDEKVWGTFNQRVAKIKGYPLAEYKRQTKYQDRQAGRKEAPPETTRIKPVILTKIKFKAS